MVACEGLNVGGCDGFWVGISVGIRVGCLVGNFVGSLVGLFDGSEVGAADVCFVGVPVRADVVYIAASGELLGDMVGSFAGTTDGLNVSHDGAKHASVKKHMYSSLPFTLAQSHMNESKDCPQHVSVLPSVQRDPSSKHWAPAWHVRGAGALDGVPVTASTDGVMVELVSEGASVDEAVGTTLGVASSCLE